MARSNKNAEEKDAADFVRTWRNVTHDGIKGDVPDWFPENAKSEFSLIRFRLWNGIKRKHFINKQLRHIFEIARESVVPDVLTPA